MKREKFVIRWTENLYLGKGSHPVEYSRSLAFPTFQSAHNKLSTLKSQNLDNGIIQNGRICQMF